MSLPLFPILGGLLIGTASMGLLLLLGRVAGISGIFWAAITGPDRGWRWLFITGLLLAGLTLHSFDSVPIPDAPAGPIWLAGFAGVLVGVGTRIGSGCTSGHGVCGIGRRSQRSFTATLVFMGTGIAIVYLTRHVLSWLA
ncbi:MAG: YeeE/YedE family protein [Luminiphilus sp.]|nr:YeeE/YedE family protein [Luminiphilus sp.]